MTFNAVLIDPSMSDWNGESIQYFSSLQDFKTENNILKKIIDTQ